MDGEWLALAYGLLRNIFSLVGLFLRRDGFGRCCEIRLRCWPTDGGGLLLVVDWIGELAPGARDISWLGLRKSWKSSCAGDQEQGHCRLVARSWLLRTGKLDIPHQ